MSVKASNWAQLQTAGGAGRKATLLLLADIADATGLLWAGVDYLAPILECDRTTVMRHLGELEQRGLVLRIERRKANGARTSTLTLLAPTGERGGMSDPREHPQYGVLITQTLSRDLHEPKSDSAQPQVASCMDLSRTVPPKPLAEPSVEPPEAKASGNARRRSPRKTADQSSLPAMPGQLHHAAHLSLSILRGVHEQRGGLEPTLRGVGLAIVAFPDRDHVEVARRVEHWLIAGNGREADCGDIVGRFRNFLKGTAASSPHRPSTNVTPIRRENASDWLRDINGGAA